ncbi:MAG: hypothetical protein LBR91_00210 [Puniceicoccales bacterium]|jgi:hypothetical protein|nr:hypothetical protein [Puniceicoccales bacterium]
MKTVEEIYANLVEKPKFMKNMLIGIVLGLIPIVNFFSFGYLVKFGTRANAKDIPGWPFSKQIGEFVRYFTDGIRAFMELLVVVGSITVLGYWIFTLIAKENFGLCLGLLIGAPAFAYAAIEEPIAWNSIPDALKKVVRVYTLAVTNFKALFVPSALFLCLQIMSFMVLPRLCMGATLFLGFIFLISHVRELDQIPVG